MSLTINQKNTALVLIDLQKGILANPTLAPHSASQVLQNSLALAQKCLATGATVIRVHVSFSPDAADRLAQPVDQPYAPPKGGMPANFSEFADEIAALSAPVTITKRNWGAFHGTELDLQLRRRNISTIILCGIATNMGVESTAREAYQHNYSLIIPEDACTSLDADMHAFSIQKILPRLARIRTTAEILSAL